MRRPNPETSYPNAKINAPNTSHTVVLEKPARPHFSACFCALNAGCIDSREVRKKPGGYWIIRDLTGLDLVGLASL